MFFELHDEKKIGYKRLSAADLGTSVTSNQTHIGLSQSVLTFLSDRDEIGEDSIFIYGENFTYIDAYFDRIENPDGSFRSPKIRKGDRDTVSIVNAIRDIVKDSKPNLQWYMFWFGLKNKKIVFFIFNNESDDYVKINGYGFDLNLTGTKSIDSSSPIFRSLTSYIEQKININAEDVLKELEIITQLEPVKPNKKYRAYDIKKANEINSQTGKDGEEAVKKYLARQVETGKIIAYTWYNEDKEGGTPFDFSIQDLKNNIIYLDVKTTGYDFNQKMIFSSQEMEFIATTHNPYCIYRVYKGENDAYRLRVCNDCRDLSITINRSTEKYSNELSQVQVGFRGAKLAVGPNVTGLHFGVENII